MSYYAFKSRFDRSIADPRDDGRIPLSGPEDEAFAEFGMFLFNMSGGADRAMAALRSWIGTWVDSLRRNGVFMDTTTLYSAATLIEGDTRALVAPVLMDLSTLVRSVVMYDHIFHLENPAYQEGNTLNEKLNESVIVTLPVDSWKYDGDLQGIGAVLGDLMAESRSILRGFERRHREGDDEELNAIIAAWGCVLGETPSPDDIWSDNGRSVDWASNGHFLLEQLLNITWARAKWGDAINASYLARYYAEHDVRSSVSHDPEPAASPSNPMLTVLSGYIHECNQRGLFGARMAELLQLPYAPNVARLPFRRYWYERGTWVAERLATLNLAQQELDHRAARELDSIQRLSLPCLLAAVLKKTDTLDGFYDELANLRRKARPFRAHRAELDQAVIDLDVPAVDRLRRAVLADTKELREAVDAAAIEEAGSGRLLSMAGVNPNAMVMAAVRVAGRLAQHQEALERRVLRRQEWFLTEMGSTVRALGDAQGRIRRLWQVSDKRVQDLEKEFSRLSALGFG